jgi:hypothetical protein
MQNQALKIILTLAMNMASALVALTAFKPGTAGFYVCAGLAMAIGNTLALFGTPIAMKPDETPKAILPGEISKFAFIPILFAGALLVSGCGTAGKAWTACELGKLPSTGQTAFALAQDLANNQNSTADDLTAAALAFAPGQFDCAAKALIAFLNGLNDSPAPADVPVRQALLSAGAASNHDHARAILREYLRGKTTSCAPVWIGLASPDRVRERPRLAVALLDPCEDAETCRQIVLDDGDADLPRLPQLRR